jgi:hypothetical protein
MSKRKSGKRINERRQQAAERQEARNKRSNLEQLKILDQKFGEGLGATRERLRLRSEIKTEKTEVVKKEEKIKEPKFKVKKGQDPIKEKKKRKRQKRENKK